jgi:lysophospholipase L1-like esterase
MKKLLYSLTLIFFALSSCDSQADFIAAEDPLTIPFCDEIVVDGNSSDWDKTGLSIPLISNLYGELNPLDFTAELKLSWGQEHLYFIASVKDDALYEDTSPLRGDGLEIFISREKGTNKMIQYIIAPGITDEFDVPRIDKYDYVKRGPESDVDDLSIKATASEGGYIIEGSIPWKEVGIVPASGTEWALNVYLTDVDPEERKTRYALYFNQDTWSNHFALQQMQLDSLSGKRSLPMMIKAYVEDRSTYKIRMFAGMEANGMKVCIKDGKGFKRKVKMEENNGISMASLDFPLGDLDSSTLFLRLETDSEYQTTLFLRDFSNRYVNTEKPNRFEDDILLFEAKDKLNFPKDNSVLFIGSSSIRLWESTIVEDFKGVDVICRGFGGSTTEDALYYFDRIVAPYNPKSIIMAEGSNDLGGGDTPEEVVEMTRKFIEKAANVIPDTRVIIMSIKVSVTRKRLVGTVMETNEMLQEMIKQYDNAEYVDVVTEMMTENGKVRGEIFSADSTHMNASGYEIWTRILIPLLNK